MNITLHRMNRGELVRQLSFCLDNMAHKSSEAIIPFRGREACAVVKVEERGNGVFLCPFDRGSPIISIAPFMGSKCHEHTVEELRDELVGCNGDDVYLDWPKDDPHTVVGKVLAAGGGDTLRVVLFPVPKDIDSVNEEVRRRCADRGCKSAELGLQYGECEGCGYCDILRKVDEEITNEKESGK